MSISIIILLPTKTLLNSKKFLHFGANLLKLNVINRDSLITKPLINYINFL